MFDQSDIDALLASASELVDEAGGNDQAATATSVEEPVVSAPAPPPPAAPSSSNPHISGDVKRILRMEVPIIVKLAERNMRLEDVLKLTTGSIVEFERSSDADLDLIVANHRIGCGQAVKIGENFGLRITELDTVEGRIHALGD